MSLIYDYLKIHGKNDSHGHTDVEIPPALTRRDSKRLNTQSLIVVLGSCLVGIILIYFTIKVFIPGQNVQQAAYTVPADVAVKQKEQPAAPGNPNQQDSVVMEQPDPSVTGPETMSTIMVFPETEKALTAAARAEAIESPADGSLYIRKKMVEPLELENKKRKITFPENVPVYTEPKESNEKIVYGSPEHYSKSSGPAANLYSYSRPDSAAQEKSRKFYQAGLQAQYKEDARSAEIFYKKTLDEVPGHIDAMVNLSALYVQQQRYAEADEVLTEILAIDPANSKALVNKGMIYLNLGNESRAAANFEAALATNHFEENALVNLAYLAEKNRDYASTERYYRQLLQISPENLEVLLAYGHLLEDQGRYPEAMALYADILELGTVKKDQRLHSKISDRVRFLAGVVKNSQP